MTGLAFAVACADAPEAFAELFVEPLGAFLEAMRGVTPPKEG